MGYQIHLNFMFSFIKGIQTQYTRYSHQRVKPYCSGSEFWLEFTRRTAKPKSAF